MCASIGDRRGNLNFDMMALDAQGKFLKRMNAMISPPQFRFDPEAQGKDFKRQVDSFLSGMKLPEPPKKDPAKLSLPDVLGDGPMAGVRMFLTFGSNRLNHYRTPTVEAVPSSNRLKKILAHPEKETRIGADGILPWLEQFYPPAIMDGMGGFETIEGEFTLRPAGSNGKSQFALLTGEAKIKLDNRTGISYIAQVSIALEYDQDSSDLTRVRGVMETTFPKKDMQGRVVENIRMTAAIESRPE